MTVYSSAKLLALPRRALPRQAPPGPALPSQEYKLIIFFTR